MNILKFHGGPWDGLEVNLTDEEEVLPVVLVHRDGSITPVEPVPVKQGGSRYWLASYETLVGNGHFEVTYFYVYDRHPNGAGSFITIPFK